MNRLCLIDADSFAYMIGWGFKPKDDDDPLLDSDEEKATRVVGATDEMVRSILLATEATHYLGALGHPTRECFRNEVAKHREYKINRKADDPTIAKWKPLIKQRLFDHWGFIAVEGLEADDIISLVVRKYQVINRDRWGDEPESAKVIIASIDKDLRQFPGTFYDYKKLEWGEVSERQAVWLFWYQMIVGDASDGVVGIPKKGDKAAHKVLDPLVDDPEYYGRMEAAVKGMYLEYYGDHYGQMIFEENRSVLGLMTEWHLFYETGYLEQSMKGILPVPMVKQSSVFDNS